MGETVTVGGILLVLVSALVWIVKRAFSSIVKQNGNLIQGALDNMKANTEAIEGNTKATVALSNTLTTQIAVRAEKDRAEQAQLDRIERLAGKAAGRRAGDT